MTTPELSLWTRSDSFFLRNQIFLNRMYLAGHYYPTRYYLSYLAFANYEGNLSMYGQAFQLTLYQVHSLNP